MQYDLNKIFELLIFFRILFPASKNETFNNKDIEHDIYLQNFYNDIIKEFEKIFDINLSRKYLTLSAIKKILNF